MSEIWRRRSPRERRMLIVGGGALAVALSYVLIIAPLIAAGEKAQRALPELRRQTAEVLRLSEEVRRLRTRPAPAATADAAALTAAALRAGLTAKVEPAPGGGFVVRVQGASFAALGGWLGEAQATYRVAVREATLRPAATSGVDAELVLDP